MTYLVSMLALAGLLTGLSIALIGAKRLLVDRGPYRIDINAGERALEVEGGQTLLSALQAEKVLIPSACVGTGVCGYCKLTVLSGGGRVLPTQTSFLTRQEIHSGVRLACQVKVRNDMAVKLVDFPTTDKGKR